MNIVSIGEVLWDVVGNDEHLGGAAFNFAVHLSRLGHTVAFVSAVGTDDPGQRILDAMPQMGLSVRYVSRVADYPTGVATVSLDAAGHPDFVIHRPAAYDFPRMAGEDIAELFSCPVDWIYFGTLMQTSPHARHVTKQLLAARNGAPAFYDVNLRAGCWEPVLVRELMAEATVVKLSDEEVETIDKMLGSSAHSLEKFCRMYAAEFGWQAVCVTRGAEGCALLVGTEYLEAGGYQVRVVDTVGAGDAFAAAFVHGVGSGWPPVRIADFANRVAALVASRPGAVPPWTLDEAEALQKSPDTLSNPPSGHRETA